MSTDQHVEYTDTTARLAILKAKAAYPCRVHPDILVLTGDVHAEMRAYTIAQNTLKYHDKSFLLERMSQAVRNELELAKVVCQQCAQR